MTSSASAEPIVLLPGFLHGSWCWNEVMIEIVASGHRAVAVDMAGHGLNARRPRSFIRRPHDRQAFRNETCPMTDVTLERAAEQLTVQLKQVGGGRPVTVVAHSAAGVLLTRVAQVSPDLVAHAVYLAAVMPASDAPPAAHTQWPEFADSRLTPLYVGDPATTGALRMDVGSDDESYRAALRDAFYNDVDPVVADACVGLLTPDAPMGMAVEPTTLTRDGWGSVLRTYIICSDDHAMPPAAQERFIREADDAFGENLTGVETIAASHSPFLSMPEKLASILTGLG